MHCHRNSSVFKLTSVLALSALWLVTASCGNNYNGSSSNSSSTLSKWKHRVLLTNAFSGTTYILNADNDQVWNRTISTTSGNNLLAESPDGKFTLEFASGANVVYTIDNTTETSTGSVIALPGDIETLAVLSGNTKAVAASRNAFVNGKPNGAVVILDITNQVIANTISLPLARRVAVNHAGTKVLAFADNSNTAYVIDTTAATATAIADPGGVLDRPVDAVFSSDDSTAYILSCGAECGGTQAKVTTFTASSNAFGNSVNVDGATTGILDSSGKLYVAGSTAGVGTLQTVDVAALASNTATATAAVSIADGYHQRMAFSDAGRLYIGSINCTNIKDAQGNDQQGCLSIYDTSAGTAVRAKPTGDVTGIQPIIGRNLVYVVQGGELVIYDVNADAARASGQLDVVGNAAAVLQID
jgi:hypothetical protein